MPSINSTTMITLKEWNNEMTFSQRRKAARLVFNNMPESVQEEMSEKWHHNLDVRHKLLLGCIFKTATGYKVRTEITL